MLIHRQNAGPINLAVGKVGLDPYCDNSVIPSRRTITIDGDAEGFAGTVVPERTLYNKLSATDKYVPRFVNGAMLQITNSTNFICDIPNAMRGYFIATDKVKWYDISAAALSADSITVDAVSALDGGTGGAGYTKITCTAEVFLSTPVSGDLLVLADGSEIDSDVVLVDEEVSLADSVDKIVSASYSCTIKASLVNRVDYINKANLAGREFYVRNE